MDREFLDAANRIRATRTKSLFVPIVGSSANDLISAASKIKNDRSPTMKNPGPIRVEMRKFTCVDLYGIQITVHPSDHSVDQFAYRYPIIDHFWEPVSKTQVIAKMMEVFNKGHQRTNQMYVERNRKHYAGKIMMSWGDDKMNFIVNMERQTIVTSEICDPVLARYN